MALIKLAALSALAYAGYRYIMTRNKSDRPAFAEGQTAPGNLTQVRDAGPEAMRDKPKRKWSVVDEQSDESFPASDPPGNY